MKRSVGVVLSSLLASCSTALPYAPSEFELSGVARFDVIAGPVRRAKLALFETGDTFYPADQSHYSPDIQAILVSDVADLGNEPGVSVPFSIRADLSAFERDREVATLILWDDVDGNDRLDPGERTQRLIPNLSTGCPVFGETSYSVPLQYEYFEVEGPLGNAALGWNHVFDDIAYRPAGDESGANLETDGYFQLL